VVRSAGFGRLTALPHETRVLTEAVSTFSSFRFSELSQPI
jgi:hypothetical protein